MKKTDESVKAGLKVEGHHPPQKENDVPAQNIPAVPGEVDEDEIVHDENAIPEPPDMSTEQDLDDLSHSIPPAENITTQEQDVDDLVHQKPPQQSGEENY
ncbi:MAG: hypothetical protein EOO04_31910 [Chitinophagaceae bacterium]|nr:MAG: hypothetical protein EOO04_31910 [Chitinophagaceae bacterium]